MLTQREAAKKLGISAPRVNKLLKQGRIRELSNKGLDEYRGVRLTRDEYYAHKFKKEEAWRVELMQGLQRIVDAHVNQTEAIERQADAIDKLTNRLVMAIVGSGIVDKVMR